ncbi:MAG: Flp pilus assembly protein CpaB [Hahellaceae bacterium]|nr:Flp pilus assembly protein CpaB [Hahellaceae bacterium]
MKLSKSTQLWLQILTALALGMSAYFLSKFLIEREKQLLATRMNEGELSGSIIVAARPLKAGEILSAENLAATDASITFLPEDTLTPAQFNDIQGLEIKQDLNEGKPLLFSYIQPPISERFSQLVGPGQRAVTIDVDNRMSIEGMIRVGDRLDLLLRQEDGSEAELLVLAESVPVIATGALRSASQSRPNDTVNESTQDTYYSSLTVILPTELAAVALLAREEGSLIALLRGPHDDQPLDFSRIDRHSGSGDTSVQYFSNKLQESGQLTPKRLREVQNHPQDLYRQLRQQHSTRLPETQP